MHEYSIVQALIEQCENQAQQHNATEISKVVIKIGILSGVEPHLLEMAFATFKEISSVCQAAELEMLIQAVEILCRDCAQASTLTEHNYVCPKCQSAAVSITEGEEMFLMQLEMA